MAKQTINVGTAANDKKGDSLRAAFQKVNANFTELYTALGLDTAPLNLGAFEFSGSTLSTTDSTSITIDQATTVTSNLTVGGDILPSVANGGDLGSAAKPWKSLYVSGSTIYIGGNALSINDQGELTYNDNRVAHESGEFMTLDNLSDLNVNSPNAGDTIAWSGSQYVNVPLTQDRLADDGDEVVLVGGANPFVTFPAITGGDQLQISGAEVSALSGNLAFSGQTTITLITNGAGAGGVGSQYFTLGADGSLTIPGTIGSDDEFKIEVNVSDSTKYIWRFGEDGELTFPDGTSQSSAGASLGQFKISGNNLGTVDNPNTGGWGGYDMYIDPGNGSDAFIYIPGLANQAANINLQISNNSVAGSIQLFGRGGVQAVVNHGVNEKVFEFADNGTLIFPDGSLALTDSVLDNGLDADLKGSVFGDDSTILVDGVSGVLRANVNVANTWTVTTGDKTWSFIYGDVSLGTNPIFEFPGSLQAVGSQTAIYAPADDLSGNWGMSIDAANSPYYVDIGEISGSNYWRFDDNGSITFPDASVQTTAYTGTANLATVARNIENEGDVSIRVNLTDSTTRIWRFGEDGDLAFPDSTVQTTAYTGNAATIDILNTNGIDTNYSITFVETRDATQILRADVDLTFNSWSNTLTAGNVTTGVLKIEDGVHEKFQTKSYATGVVTHDCSLGHVFYHTTPSANWTVNLTNLNLAVGYATAVTLVIEQGAPGYYPSAVQVAGNAVPLAWQGNTTPTPSSNRFDVVTFSILYDGLYTVLGQLTGF